MKNSYKHLLAVVAALGIPLAVQAEEKLSQAQITQIVKDVKTIDPGKTARAAVMKETLQGEQAVRTGIESRTELLFNDKTITRLGANTHFSFTEGTRNMSLQSGVLLLQVPKNNGGAKIETAAVTAAVTGTTIMVEAGKDYTKLIVLEGECCLWPKESKKDSKFFKMKHKQCATAGQEIIMRNGDKEVPDPVYVNLKTLENTSLLITGDWGTDLNHGPIDVAADDQKPKDYIPTNLAIIGAGTDVTIIQGQLPEDDNTPPPSGPPGKFGPLTTIVTPNPYIINNSTVIVTDPVITTNGLAGYGKIYRGPSVDGAASNYLFQVSDPALNLFFGVQNGKFVTGGVAVFKFTSLQIAGAPSIDVANGGPANLALVAVGNITTGSPGENGVDLDLTGLHSLTLATEGGSINLGEGFTFENLDGFLALYNRGGKDITINADILEGGLTALVVEEGPPPQGPQGDLLINTGGKLIIGSHGLNSLTFVNGIWSATGGMSIGGNISVNNQLTLNSPADITLGDPEFGGSIDASTLTVNGNNVTVLSGENIGGEFINLNSKGVVDIDGYISAYSVTIDTTGGTGALPENGLDVFDDPHADAGNSSFISASNITVNSRGYLGLNQYFDGEGYSDYINSVQFDNYSFQTLNLTAPHIVVETDFTTRDSEADTTLNLTSVFNNDDDSGNIIIQGAVDVTHFNAVAAGTIYGNSVDDSSPSVHADTIHLQVGEGATLSQDSDNSNALLTTSLPSESTGELELILKDFDNPTNELNVTTAGDLTVSGAFSDDHNSGFSEQGMTDLTLNLTANFTGINNDKSHDIILTGPINVYSFNGNASGEIYGAGSITATYTNLQVGVDATLINNVVDQGSGNFSTTTTLGYGDEKSIQLILDDEGNTTNSLTITSNNLTVGDEGNPDFFEPDLNLSLNANNGTLTLNGSVYVSNFYGYGAFGFAGPGKVTAQSITMQVGGDGTLTNTVTDLGSSNFVTTTTFGPDGGTAHLVLDDSDNATTNLSVIAGQTLTVATDFSAPYLTQLSLTGYFGGVNIDGAVSVNGANAQNVEDAGGNGGTINMFSEVDINVNKPVVATTGLNGSSVAYGGAGGTISAEAYGTINVNDKIEVSSSAGNGRSSQGGTINLTSHKSTGTAVNIANTGVLNSLLDAAAPGPGGNITIIADSGGDIAVSGTVRADKGTLDIHTSGTAAGNIALNGANLSADVVKVNTLGTNGTLTIGGSTINGDTAIKLYAAGSNGTVNFIANTSLTGASVKSIAGNTVNVFNGVNVSVSGGAATVFTNHPNYTGSGGNGTRTGQFTGVGTTTQPFSSRPAF